METNKPQPKPTHVTPENLSEFTFGCGQFSVEGFGEVEFIVPMVDGWCSPGGVKLHIEQVIDRDQYKLRGNLSPGDVVIDVGASVGTFMWFACQLGARVFSFEPSPKEFQVATMLAKHHGLNATVFPHAVSDRTGTAKFHAGWQMAVGDGQLGGDEMMHVEGDLEGEFFEVPTVTLDEFVAQSGLDRLNVIKVDTEGHERRVLEGAMETIDRFRPRLLLAAYHHPGDMEELVELVRSRFPEYAVTFSVGGDENGREMNAIMAHPPR